MSSHHRQDLSDTTSAAVGARTRSSVSASRSATARQEPSQPDQEDPIRAFVDNPDFISRLADALRANPGDLHGPPGPPGTPAVGGNEQNSHWRADEVGFFFPDLHSSYGPAEIVTIGKESFYRNASVFLDRLDDIVRLRGGEIVRNNIPTCLRGAALQWYTTELGDLEKQSLRSPSQNSNPLDPIHRWKMALKRRWDPPASVSLQNFMSTRYTIGMAMAGIPVVQYFATKLRLAKEAGFTGVTQQLLAIWNGLDVEIREHIDEPDEHTSIDRFR